MFSIYNETDKPVELINLNTDKMVILKKPVSLGENYSKSIDIKMSKKIIFSSPMELIKMQTKLKELVLMDKPEAIIDLELSTIFNRTDFSPFILSTPSAKAMGVISIDLENRKIIGINKTSCFVFDHICTKKEITMFVSINNEQSPLVITLYDKKLDKVIKYIFGNTKSCLTLTKEINNVSDRKILNIKMRKRYTLNKFRPARSTYNILSLPQQKLPDVIKPDLYCVTTFNTVDKSLDTIFNKLVSSSISAITIYEEGMTPTQLEKAVIKAKTYMSIVYSMNLNGKITRHKVK